MVVCTTSTSKGIIAQHAPVFVRLPTLAVSAHRSCFHMLQAKPTSMVRLALALHLTTLIEIDRSGGLKSSYRLAV